MLPLWLLFASLRGAPLDLQGHPVDPLKSADTRATVLVFVRTECPISNRYAPEIQRIAAHVSSQGIRFWMVFPDGSEKPEAIREYLKEYGYEIGALRDPEHILVKAAKARVTPEAAVFLPGRKLVYHGRIDNRYVDFGKARPVATVHDLEAALEAIIAGQPIEADATRAVGCYMADIR